MGVNRARQGKSNTKRQRYKKGFASSVVPTHDKHRFVK